MLIKNIDKTISARKGRIIMKDNEKFEGFKKKLINENEQKYGAEARERYGEEAVEKSNQKLKHLTQEQFEKLDNLAIDIKKTLAEAYKTKDPSGELAQKAVQMHKEWLSFYWDNYTKEAHAALAQMYIQDERFTKYYDDIQQGAAEFLKNAVMIYAEK